MVKYCSECGNKLKESFKMPKYCSECGNKLEGSFKFCPECGKKMPMIKDVKRLEEIETKEKVKTKAEEKTRFALPKPSLKISKKTAIAIISIVCVAVVVAAAVLVISPFGNWTTGVKSAGGRTFTVTVNNTYSSSADCYLKIGNLKDNKYSDWNISSGESKTFEINEDDQIIPQDDYDITLYATIDGDLKEATASAVTESAEFLISSADGQLSVNCTGFQ